MTAPEPRALPDGFPRAVTDPFCAHDHVVETPTDRRLLWHIEGFLAVRATTPEQRDLTRRLRSYLNASCEHHWHESLTCCDPTNASCVPAHRQCLWCHDVEWLDGAS